jgi:hypothetical protein
MCCGASAVFVSISLIAMLLYHASQHTLYARIACRTIRSAQVKQALLCVVLEIKLPCNAPRSTIGHAAGLTVKGESLPKRRLRLRPSRVGALTLQSGWRPQNIGLRLRPNEVLCTAYIAHPELCKSAGSCSRS